MSNHSDSNACDSTQADDSTKHSVALDPPDDKSDGASWEMRRTVEDKRRQHLLRALAEQTEPIGVTELAERIVGFRTSDDREEPRPVVIERERTQLCRVDLPQLNEAGYVAYDADESEVALPESPDQEFTSMQSDDD